MAAKSALGHVIGRLRNNLEQLQKRDQCPLKCVTSEIKEIKEKEKLSADEIV